MVAKYCVGSMRRWEDRHEDTEHDPNIRYVSPSPASLSFLSQNPCRGLGGNRQSDTTPKGAEKN